MNKYPKITRARKLLELPERATMKDIKSNYRKLLSNWHPDTCTEETERCEEMTRDIIDAYRIIMNYCSDYKYSFEKEAVRHHLSAEEWWFDRFGQDLF